MFNFHKPRVYRSTEGCCICRAKSSSSRFTDSRKYETESVQCFNLKNPRHGEICNACVLLVKRYKRLPVGNKRHWGHVVDARAGPGTKSLAKQKKRDEWGESSNSNSKSFIPEKFAKIFKKSRNGKTKNISNNYKTNDESSSKSKLTECFDNQSDSNESDDESIETTECAMPYTRQNQMSSPPTVVQFQTQTRASAQKRQLAAASARSASTRKLGSKRRRMLTPMKHRPNIASNESFFERSDLIKLDICCGVVYQYAPMPGFIVIDTDEYRPCEKHRKLANTQTTTTQQQFSQSQKTQTGINLTPLVRLASVSLADGGASTVAATGDLSSLIKHTPALKKHHLFYKRQSESFPKVDLNPAPLPLEIPSGTNAEATSLIARYVTTGFMPRHSTTTTALQELSAAATTVVAASSSNKSMHNIALVLKPCAVGGGLALQQNATHAVTLTTSVGASSPSALSTSSSCSSTSSSSSSSSATKFNDNSSDSGFDEHVQDRKSASPSSQDEHGKKPPVRNNGLQELVISADTKINGQRQNMILAGNELAPDILQKRPQRSLKITAANKANVDGGTFVDVDGVVNLGSHNCGNSGAGVPGVSTSVSASKKLRAIYNNNTIQHENGVTTILPASSLAASNQTAAMNAIAPSTVTITPSPCGIIMPKKITLNGHHLQPLALNTNIASSSSSSNIVNSINGGSSQKIIFVKAKTTAAPTA